MAVVVYIDEPEENDSFEYLYNKSETVNSYYGDRGHYTAIMERNASHLGFDVCEVLVYLPRPYPMLVPFLVNSCFSLCLYVHNIIQNLYGRGMYLCCGLPMCDSSIKTTVFVSVLSQCQSSNVYVSGVHTGF